MSYSAEENMLSSLLSEEKSLSVKYAELLSSVVTPQFQNKIQYIQRTNNETISMLITEADSRGYIKK
ncbi:MAG: hypothetical protein E7490_02780 [Ruminococcaceae bacterium]|nr:hypothetical protein [Oscillospiraceae bacterium]